MDCLTEVQVDTRRLPDAEKADLSELTEEPQGDRPSQRDRPLPETLAQALRRGSRRLAMTCYDRLKGIHTLVKDF